VINFDSAKAAVWRELAPLREALSGVRERNKQRFAAEQREEMRRATDDFGCGSLLRYGEDRYGSGSK
jgi:hypothetical protein